MLLLSSADFFSKKSLRNTIRVHMSNSLDSDKDQRSLRYIVSGHRFYSTVHLAEGYLLKDQVGFLQCECSIFGPCHEKTYLSGCPTKAVSNQSPQLQRLARK